MTKKEIEKNRELARLYYMSGEAQNVIAERIGVSSNTISRWVTTLGWDTQRAAKKITRTEVAAKMLRKLSERLDSEDWTPDELAKAASAIEKLDKKNNVVTIIEVFASYNNWLNSRMRLDPELTPELVQVMTKYQDLFVAEKSDMSIEFKQ